MNNCEIFGHKYKNVPERHLEKLKNESFARQLMTIKSMIAFCAELCEAKDWSKLNKDIHLMAELVNNLPDDMEISTMIKIESEHKELHSRLWKLPQYIKSYTSKLSRF